MVSIYSKPYTSLTANINGVYNGLPFVLDSNMKARGNFRYIAEVYAANTKVAELRHSPDVSAGRKGVFDVARIVENYLAGDIKFDQTYQSFDSNTTAVQYYVEFGEEYSRMSFVVNTSPDNELAPNWTRLHLDNATDTEASGVIVGGSTKYNGWINIATRTANSYVIPKNYAGQTEKTTWIVPTYTGRDSGSVVIDGTTYMSFKIYRPTDNKPRFQVGNKVVLNNFASSQPVNGFYTNSEWSVIKVEENFGTISGKKVDRFTISAPYKYTIPAGYLIYVGSYDNIIYKNQLSTLTDRSYATNSARQYEVQQLTGINGKRESNWPDQYKKFFQFSTNPTFTASQYCKTLSERPGTVFPTAEQTIDICWGETYQLSWLGKFLNGQSSNKAIDTYMRLETWSSTGGSSTGGTWQVSTGIAQAGSTLTYVRTGNITGNWSVGDYITANVTSLGTFTGRVVSVTLSGGSTYIFTNIASATGGAGSIISDIAVKYYDTILQPNVTTISCGTWNLKTLTEMENMTCYKYFLYPVIPTATSYYTPTGGVGPFNAESNGVNYPGTRTRVGLKTTFSIQSCCETVQPYKVAWLNKEGGFDFYKFTARVDKSLDIQRTEFYQKMSKVQGNNLYAYRPGDRGRTNWNNTSIESWIVNSDWLTQAELDWMTNLYESPEVYLIQEGRRTSPSGAWTEPVVIPLNVRNTQVELHNKSWRNTETGRMYRYVLEFESAKNRIVQRGGRPATLAYKSLYE